MPKIVDVAARRAMIAEACWRVIARDGIAGVTTRAVSTEAGIGPSLLFHYFTDKDELIVAAFEHLAERFRARLYPAMESAPDALERLRVMALSNLPLVDEQRVEFGVWLSMWAHTYSSESLRTIQRDLYQAARDLVAELVQAAIDEGHLRPDVDPVIAGAQVIAITDGFIVQLLLDVEHHDVTRLAVAAANTLIDSWRTATPAGGTEGPPTRGRTLRDAQRRSGVGA